jgi:hypothetical protein
LHAVVIPPGLRRSEQEIGIQLYAHHGSWLMSASYVTCHGTFTLLPDAHPLHTR